MIPTEASVSHVMNEAVRYLEEAELPVTPESHYDMCNAWREFLGGMREPEAILYRKSLTIAMNRLLLHLMPPPTPTA